MELRLLGALTSLRPAADTDVELLVRWHADSNVSRYLDGETFTAAQIRARLAGADVEPFIAEVDGRPVAYLHAWRSDMSTGGLDMFVIPSERGRGYGPDAARALATYLRDERGWSAVTVDPYTWNDSAVRAWRRAGFTPVRVHPPDAEHTAAWLEMAFDG